jgi:hypothetical protein
MWLALFTVTIAAAIGFVVAAIILQPARYRNKSPVGIDRRSTAFGNALLLPRRMEFLGLDSAEIGRTERQLLQQLEARCRVCLSKDRCAADLVRAVDPMDRSWRDYCPNAATLDLLSRLRDGSLRLCG